MIIAGNKVNQGIFAIGVLALGICAGCATGPKWYKGNTHTHTFWSDGKEFPETVADRYKEMGYHFLALSDHNAVSRGERWKNYNPEKMDAAVERTNTRWGKEHLQFREKDGKRQVRLMPLDEIRKLVEEPGRFIMIESVELSSELTSKKAIHSNPVNITEPLTVSFRCTNTVEETLMLHEHLVQEQVTETGRPIFWQINHPNYKSSITAEQLANVKGAHAVEVMNGSSKCLNEGNNADLPSVEYIWDVANTIRLKAGLPLIYGCATDDTHDYHFDEPTMDGPGLAWVMVKSEELSPDAITEAMLRGDFYFSTGITLKTVELNPHKRTFAVEVEPERGLNYTIAFVGSTADGTGKVLQTTEGSKAVYSMKGNELFVRAVVHCDAPPVCAYDEFSDIVRKAWTQPMEPMKNHLNPMGMNDRRIDQ